MATAMDVEEFLESVAKEQEEMMRQEARESGDDGSRRSGDRRDRDRDYDRDRARDRDRNYDRNYDRDRDYDRDRRDPGRRGGNTDRYRELNEERDKSRDREHRRPRRDDSRPRSTYKDADSDAEGPHPTTRGRLEDNSREHRGGHDHNRDRRRSGDYYSGGGRPRSRSPRRRDDRDRYRERSRDRRSRRDDDRRPRRTITPEITEDDRDKRTIFVQQIAARAETRHLRQFFEAVGPVVEAQIVKDRVTGRSKGVGYVEFRDEESVGKAIELTGQKLKGVPIIAQLTEAEKNRASRAAATEGNANGVNQAPFHRLFIGNIHFSIEEHDLEVVFAPYGEIESLSLNRDESKDGQPGRSRGYGHVQFRDPAAAKEALTSMNNFELAGRQIRVGLGSDKFTNESTQHLARNWQNNASTFEGSSLYGHGGRGVRAGGGMLSLDRTHGKDDRGVSSASALDDTDVGGVNNMNRERLMSLLSREKPDEPKKDLRNGSAVAPKAPVHTYEQPAPSKCIKIENCYDIAEEVSNHGPNWWKDMELDIKHECTKTYGKVVHIHVDQDVDGEVHVKFDSAAAGEKAIQGLNGRTFNFRTIMASYVLDYIYHTKFPDASRV